MVINSAWKVPYVYMIFPQNTLSKNAYAVIVGVFCLSRRDVVAMSKKMGKLAVLQAVSNSQLKTSDIACNNEKATSAIHSYLVNRIDQQAKKQSDIIQQQAGTPWLIWLSWVTWLVAVAINQKAWTVAMVNAKPTVSFNMPSSAAR